MCLAQLGDVDRFVGQQHRDPIDYRVDQVARLPHQSAVQPPGDGLTAQIHDALCLNRPIDSFDQLRIGHGQWGMIVRAAEHVQQLLVNQGESL